MAKADVLDILRSKKMSPLEFNFESMWIPPMNYYLTQQDIDNLRYIATSIKLSSKINQKYKMIDDIMRSRGFKRFSAGTNRVVYSFLEDTRFLVKIAVDKVGMQDNPLEYENQFLLKPYVTKMFYISQCGTVGFAERVLPIKNKAEFREISSDVFEIIVNKILGKYVVEDIGTRYFMNWGIRPGFGPVLLDYPYVYKLDGKKLYCTKQNPITNTLCNGEIDYDAGFNQLICTRCGKRYLAINLRDNSIDNKIIIKGGIEMRVILKKGNEIVNETIPTEEVMERHKRPEFKKQKGMVVTVTNKDGTIVTFADKKPEINNIEDSKIEGSVDLNTIVNIGILEGMSECGIKTNNVEEATTAKEVEVETHSNNPSNDFKNDNESIDTTTVTPIDESTSSITDALKSIESNIPSKPLRDEKGRFVSTGGNKNKDIKSNNSKRVKNIQSNFIPSSEV